MSMKSRFRMPEECPKCGQEATFDTRYVPRGVVVQYPSAEGAAYYVLGAGLTAHGPCMMKTCRVCRYTYTETPADGEGTENTDG